METTQKKTEGKTAKRTALQHSHLQDLYRTLKEVEQASNSLISSLSIAQLTWKPAAKTWSILQCFEHLYTVNQLYMGKIEGAIQNASDEDGLERFRPSWFGRKFIDFQRPESKRKVKTLKLFKPAVTDQDVTVVAQFMAQQKDLLNLIVEADQCNLNKVKLSSPATRLIRFSLGEALTLLVIHEQRHLLQAQNLQLHINFPEFKA